MDGIHDMGGMQGFGSVIREADEPVFHAPWEARIFALASAVPYAVPFGDDRFRPAIETMPPERYLVASYYEKWLAALEKLLIERGALSPGELEDRSFNPLPPTLEDAKPLAAKNVEHEIFAGYSQARPGAADAPRRFTVGARVRTRAHMPIGHNRLPRYARDKTGKVESLHGSFLVADRSAAGAAVPETLYTVVFDSADLFGEDAKPGDRLSLDLWDSYLEPAP